MVALVGIEPTSSAYEALASANKLQGQNSWVHIRYLVIPEYVGSHCDTWVVYIHAGSDGYLQAVVFRIRPIPTSQTIAL